MFAPGTLLAGKYRIDRVLGQGGMGVVVAATHVYLGQRVALKFLLPELVGDPVTVERFLREARASAALRGESVCRVSDVGTLETGSPYIVMELLDGRDLATMIAERGPLPVELASQYVVQACVGLAEAHALGIVHRDLKPANLFLTWRPDGTQLVKVLDFGIAKAQRDAGFSMTRTATVMGSPGYMSPEQLRSTRDADIRSDIWALGVILYELVSGRAPFVAESITELALRVAMDPLPPLAVPGAAGYEAVVARCLEKDPARRFQDVAALAHALARFGGPKAHELAAGAARVLNVAASPPVPPSTVAVAQMPTTLGSSAGAANSALRGRRWGMVGGAAAAVIAGALAIVAFPGGRVATPHAGSPAPEAAAPGADPAPSMPAEPEAPPSPAVAPPPAAVPTRAMAKLAVAPVDAGTVDAADAAPAVARPESPPVDPDAPARTKPHKPRTAIPAQPEDVGASRF